MKNVPKILLRNYLRRRPLHLRLNQFNFLARYSWLQNVLEELKPELFPQQREAPIEPLAVEPEPLEEADVSLLNETLLGQRGTYRVEQSLGRRGNGWLFQGMQLGLKQPVVIKEYRLPERLFSQEEARKRQQAFVSLAGLSRIDARSQDLRVFSPIEAIADMQSLRRCYLITDGQDAALPLRQKLAIAGAFPPATVRSLLGQLLQTLALLHQQKVVFPSGQIQAGVVHGNLSLDSVLWVDRKESPFLYLSDFALWESPFDPTLMERQTAVPTPQRVADDLAAVGEIGYCLLTGHVPLPPATAPSTRVWPRQDLPLESFLRQLLAIEPPLLPTAEVAWQTLLQLPNPPEAISVAPPFSAAPPVTPQRRWRRTVGLAGVAGLALLGGLWLLLPRGRLIAQDQGEAAACCLPEVGAIPAGQFRYAAVQGGTWEWVWRLRQPSQPPQSLADRLAVAHPGFDLSYQPVPSATVAIQQVRAGAVDFAVVPLAGEAQALAGLGVEPIAYDGVAVFVPFSYAERQRGLPSALNGQISLETLQTVYLGNVETWREIGGPWLPLERYASDNPEAQAVFEQGVLRPLPLSPTILRLPTLALLRQVIQDFERREVGSLGFAPLSQVFGQCSVYPLALKTPGQRAVHPWILQTGEAITPETDLCDRKGTYHPNVTVFAKNQYPLAYTLAVVFPLDNSRDPAGAKFAELMQTLEGQRILAEAGLVPLQPIQP